MIVSVQDPQRLLRSAAQTNEKCVTMCKCDKLLKIKSVRGADLDWRKVLVKLRVQWRQLIYRAVETAVVMTQDLAQKERGKRYIYNNSLCKQKLQLHTEDYLKHRVLRVKRAADAISLESTNIPHKRLFRASSPQTQTTANGSHGCRM